MAYLLQYDETILYEHDVKALGQQGRYRLMLTNLNIVIISYFRRNYFADEEMTYTVHPVQDIKSYEGKPQFFQKGSHVRILFRSYERNLRFSSLIETTKFSMALTKLLTGKSASARGAEKVKNAISHVDHALGIDTVGTAKRALGNGVVGTLVLGTGKKKSRSSGSRKKRDCVRLES